MHDYCQNSSQSSDAYALHHQVYEALFTIRHAIKNFPDGKYSDISDLSM
jgi:hypothetical protein